MRETRIGIARLLLAAFALAMAASSAASVPRTTRPDEPRLESVSPCHPKATDHSDVVKSVIDNAAKLRPPRKRPRVSFSREDESLGKLDSVGDRLLKALEPRVRQGRRRLACFRELSTGLPFVPLPVQARRNLKVIAFRLQDDRNVEQVRQSFLDALRLEPNPAERVGLRVAGSILGVGLGTIYSPSYLTSKTRLITEADGVRIGNWARIKPRIAQEAKSWVTRLAKWDAFAAFVGAERAGVLSPACRRGNVQKCFQDRADGAFGKGGIVSGFVAKSSIDELVGIAKRLAKK